MAENTDDLLEEATANNEDKAEAKTQGLSPSLLIKIAIGLGILLIAMVVAFFMMPSGSDTPENEASFQSQVEPVENESVPEATTDTDSIELPPVAETTPTAEPNATSETAGMAIMAATTATAARPMNSPDKVLSEILALQQQIAGLQQENQTLIKRVEALVKENEMLKTQVNQMAATRPSTDEVISDEQLVNTGEVPLYYRQNGYLNTAQPELKPKWGEFDELNSGKN